MNDRQRRNIVRLTVRAALSGVIVHPRPGQGRGRNYGNAWANRREVEYDPEPAGADFALAHELGHIEEGRTWPELQVMRNRALMSSRLRSVPGVSLRPVVLDEERAWDWADHLLRMVGGLDREEDRRRFCVDRARCLAEYREFCDGRSDP